MRPLALSALLLTQLAHAAEVRLDRLEYWAGDEIRVEFVASRDYPSQAWVGVVPADIPHGDEAVNDKHDVDYAYLSGQPRGTALLVAPDAPGAWEVRMNDGQGHEVASARFAVRRPDYSLARVWLDDLVVPPGSPLEVHFTAPQGLPHKAWIGLIPSEVPHGDGDVNDANDLAWAYLAGRTDGVLGLTAPELPGSYDLRLSTSDHRGEEIASVTFQLLEVDTSRARLTLDRTDYIPGDHIEVRFQVPAGLSPKAWVGIVPAEVPHGDEQANDAAQIGWRYLQGRTEGTLRFAAPAQGGSYTFRLHDREQEGNELHSVDFRVDDAVTADEMASRLAEHGRVALYGIHFDTAEATIRPDSAHTLDQIGALLARDPGLRLSVEGHTDSQGADAYNLELSRRRAESVKAYLVERLGVDAGRLHTEGFGEDRPVASNDTEPGRALNRRVELARLP